MAHDHVKEDLQLETETGRITSEILATLVGGTLLICSVLAQFIYPAAGDGTNDYATLLGLVSAMLLGTPLVWVAIKDLAHGHTHMNELVALAVLAAFAMGAYQEAAAISFFMILSVLIENRTALGAQRSIEELIRITPTRAARIEEGGEREVDAQELVPGDVVRVRPGDNVPADGAVRSGTSTVNEAPITGESMPAEKGEGDEVFGGSINLTGAMDIEVTKAGEDTTLGRVKELILQAESTRIPIARMIDRYAAWYTPVILMLAFVVWFFVQRSGGENPMERVIAMLVVACPCALILATPTAMVAGLSAAARLGVLIKSVTDLEAARNLSAMVFDKTGTLTTGELEVAKLTPEEGVDAETLLQAAASVEQQSRHPVARAITQVARRARLTLETPAEFHETSGRGVEGVVDGHRVAVGRSRWLIEQSDESLAESLRERLERAQAAPDAEGLSLLFVVRDGEPLGWIGLADNARPQAAAAMDRLRELGLKRLIIVTGDRESVAKRIAGQMHTDYRSEVLPQQKLDMVGELRNAGHRVAVIGDGVNDAPALAAGDISIAMGAAGSDVAIHSASIALMNNNLNRIPFIVELSRRASAVIRQNLAVGIGFIVIFLGLAAANIVTPIMAAILHLLSGLVVIFNSARLVRMGEDIEQAERPAASGGPASGEPAAPAPAPAPA